MTDPQVSVPTDQVHRLRQLWDAGLSALECGRELGFAGEPSQVREAVLRAIETAPAIAPVRSPRPRKPKAERTGRRSNLPARFSGEQPSEFAGESQPEFKSDGFDGTPTEWDLQIPVEQRKNLFQLTPSTCHWPVGEPRDPAFFFCGGDVHEEEPYCADHCRRAYGGNLHRRRDIRRRAA